MMQSKQYAVTGGIGSGKTLFCNILKELGFAVFSCDEISHMLWENGVYREGLAQLFPDCLVEGEIDKTLLAERVFSDERELAKLNAYSHPKIMKRLLEETDKVIISFSEVPLLFEGGYEGLFNGVILLKRGERERIEAVALRDGLTEEAVRLRMARQCGESASDGKNCIIVENDGTIENLRKKALEVLQILGCTI